VVLALVLTVCYVLRYWFLRFVYVSRYCVHLSGVLSGPGGVVCEVLCGCFYACERSAVTRIA
jgi:hypothetical protein